jgi:hypothetical protein
MLNSVTAMTINHKTSPEEIPARGTLEFDFISSGRTDARSGTPVSTAQAVKAKWIFAVLVYIYIYIYIYLCMVYMYVYVWVCFLCVWMYIYLYICVFI